MRSRIFFIFLFILLIICYLRTTRGIDLSDEMQYYGQIMGIIESGKLFSNDLFIQQLVYLPFYPIFYLYHSFFGYDGFIFVGRLIMSLINVLLFFYLFKKLISLQFSNLLASVTAFSSILAIYHSPIYALSYNTISQTLWILFFIQFYEWDTKAAFSWLIIPFAVLLAHPPSAILMVVILIIRYLIDRNYKQLYQFLLGGLIGGIFFALLLIYFAPINDYVSSVVFSKGYGVGGLISRNDEIIKLLLVVTMYLLVFWLKIRINAMKYHILLIFSLLGGVFYIWFRIHSLYDQWWVYIFSFLGALTYSSILSFYHNNDKQTINRINWLVILILLHGCILSIFSDNAFRNSGGAFMAGLPLLVCISVNGIKSDKIINRFLRITSLQLLSILYIVYWSQNPYREVSWWHANHNILSVPQFKFIKSSKDRIKFIEDVQTRIGQSVKNRKTLITGIYPAFYFVLGAIPETCMFFMHGIEGENSKKVFVDYLNNKSPEVIVHIYGAATAKSYPNAIIVDNVINEFVKKHGYYFVESDTLFFDSSTDRNPKQLEFAIYSKSQDF